MVLQKIVLFEVQKLKCIQKWQYKNFFEYYDDGNER